MRGRSLRSSFLNRNPCLFIPSCSHLFHLHSRFSVSSHLFKVAMADNLGAVITATTTPKSQPYFPKKGQAMELVCLTLAFKGKGVCKVADTGFVVMCDRALPGERFIGRVVTRKKNYAEVTKMKTLCSHFDIVDAPCQYAAHCGGCRTQNLSYEAQLRAKEAQVLELMVHVGKFYNNNHEFSKVIKKIVPCDTTFNYRNKMEFSFSTQSWAPDETSVGKEDDEVDDALGLHAPGSFDKVLNLKKCLLQSDSANKVLTTIQDCWRDEKLGLSAYDVHRRTGFLKHMVLKTGRNINKRMPEVMVNIITSSFNPDLMGPLVDKISHIPEVVSIVNSIGSDDGNTSMGVEEHTLYGKSTIMELLRGLHFHISANSFFQTNTSQAEVLYKLIEDCAGLRGDGSEIILDLFCGTGTIGLTLAPRVKHVYGYEILPQSISDARRNADLNGIYNATFFQADLNKIGTNFGTHFPMPHIVISDPSRAGMHINLIKFLLNLKAGRVVYVSCNPSTCARDLHYLCHGLPEKNMKGVYKLISVHPVDMFPHTPHIECVSLLEISSPHLDIL